MKRWMIFLMVILGTALLAGAISAAEEKAAPEQAEPQPAKPQPDFVNSIGMPFVRIPAGKSVMGTSPGEWGRGRNEGPQREVTITHPFHMCQYETVNKWFEQFINETKYNPHKKGESDFQARKFPITPSKKPGRVEHTPEYPIIWVSWYASLRFCNWLSEKEGRPPVYLFDEKKKEGKYELPVVTMTDPYSGGYRLPTEAEWEYAARAGTTTAFFFGKDDTDFAGYAYVEAYGRPMPKRMLPPKGILPNPWGLYHMVGNVGEWCWDRYSPSYQFYETTDPTGPLQGEYRVNRDGASTGGGGTSPWYGRSGTRMMDFPTVTRYDVGFRVVFNKKE